VSKGRAQQLFTPRKEANDAPKAKTSSPEEGNSWNKELKDTILLYQQIEKEKHMPRVISNLIQILKNLRQKSYKDGPSFKIKNSTLEEVRRYQNKFLESLYFV